jgi:hypothetical protein
MNKYVLAGTLYLTSASFCFVEALVRTPFSVVDLEDFGATTDNANTIVEVAEGSPSSKETIAEAKKNLLLLGSGNKKLAEMPQYEQMLQLIRNQSSALELRATQREQEDLKRKRELAEEGVLTNQKNQAASELNALTKKYLDSNTSLSAEEKYEDSQKLEELSKSGFLSESGKDTALALKKKIDEAPQTSSETVKSSKSDPKVSVETINKEALSPLQKAREEAASRKRQREEALQLKVLAPLYELDAKYPGNTVDDDTAVDSLEKDLKSAQGFLKNPMLSEDEKEITNSLITRLEGWIQIRKTDISAQATTPQDVSTSVSANSQESPSRE